MSRRNRVNPSYTKKGPGRRARHGRGRKSGHGLFKFQPPGEDILREAEHRAHFYRNSKASS